MKKFTFLVAAAVAVVVALGAGTSAISLSGSPATKKNTQSSSYSQTTKSNKPHKPHKPHKSHPPKPYPGKVETKCDYSVPSSAKKYHTVKGHFRVRAHGNARPSGKVYIYVYKVNPSTHKFEPVRTIKKAYTGPKTYSVSLGSFSKAGTYATKVSFKPPSSSVHSPSTSDYEYFKVK